MVGVADLEITLIRLRGAQARGLVVLATAAEEGHGGPPPLDKPLGCQEGARGTGRKRAEPRNMPPQEIRKYPANWGTEKSADVLVG